MAKPAYQVRLTPLAEWDLETLHQYMAEHRSLDHADRLLDAVEAKIASLERLPERGVRPRELLDLGIERFRQVSMPPYRLIYRVVGKTVFVHLIADGRRDMKALLAKRLLGK